MGQIIGDYPIEPKYLREALTGQSYMQSLKHEQPELVDGIQVAISRDL